MAACSSSSETNSESQKLTTTTTLPSIEDDNKTILAAFPAANEISDKSEGRPPEITEKLATTTAPEDSGPKELCPGVKDESKPIKSRTSASTTFNSGNSAQHNSDTPYINIAISAYSSVEDAKQISVKSKNRIDKCGEVQLFNGTIHKREIYETPTLKGADTTQSYTDIYVTEGIPENPHYQLLASKGRFVVSVATLDAKTAERVAFMTLSKLP